MKDIKFNDAQIDALATFYMGISSVADMYKAYQKAGVDLSPEVMHKFFALIVEGADITAESIRIHTDPKVAAELDAADNIIDFEAYKRNGGYLN